MAPSFWQGRNVLVGGATGFLGGWLTSRLLREGARVIAIVRRPRPDSQFAIAGLAHQTQVECGSLHDAGFLERVFSENRIDVFYHVGYGADVNRVLAEPLECFRSSTESTWVILDLIRRLQPECISVISSTDKAYGSQPLPYLESSALRPLHPYEVAKASQDLAAQSFGKIYGLRAAVTRCGNFFGGYDFNFTRLIPGACRSLAAGERPVLRSDGRFTRDFLYIEDAVDAQLLLAERLSANPRLYGEAFNFSYGEQLEVVEILRRIAYLAGRHIEPLVANHVQAEIRHMHLSSQKAEELLGWRPCIGFEEGLRRTVQWYGARFGKGPDPLRRAAASLISGLVTWGAAEMAAPFLA
jgi:CDP-glucose 4,6-dehydratase